MVVRGRKRNEVGKAEDPEGNTGQGRALREDGGEECAWHYIIFAVALAALGTFNMVFFAKTLADFERTSPTSKGASVTTSTSLAQPSQVGGIQKSALLPGSASGVQEHPLSFPSQRTGARGSLLATAVEGGKTQGNRDGATTAMTTTTIKTTTLADPIKSGQDGNDGKGIREGGVEGSGSGEKERVGGSVADLRGVREAASSLSTSQESERSAAPAAVPTSATATTATATTPATATTATTTAATATATATAAVGANSRTATVETALKGGSSPDVQSSDDSTKDNANVNVGQMGDVGSGTRYKAGDFPIAVIAYNRPHYLKRCLASLLSASLITAEMVTVYQDGSHSGVDQEARDAGVVLERHERTQGREGAQHIAAHYGWALKRMFDKSPGAAYGIVLEEDMVVSPDFLTYFLRLAPAMDADPSLFCISAYNDNGLDHLAEDVTLVYRTEWFVGLGWLIKRDLFVRDWLPEWPETHWDHWLRQDAVRKGRECLFPEVSRDFHIGEQGMNMDSKHYKRYNARVKLNTDATARLPTASSLIQSEYEASINRMMERGTVVGELSQLDLPLSPGEGGAGCASPTIVYYAAGLSDPGSNDQGRMDASSPWKPISNYFGLWHEPKRGLHNGMHRFHYKGRCILLVDESSGYASQHMPKGAVAFGGQHFGAATWARVSSNPSLEPLISSK